MKKLLNIVAVVLCKTMSNRLQFSLRSAWIELTLHTKLECKCQELELRALWRKISWSLLKVRCPSSSGNFYMYCLNKIGLSHRRMQYTCCCLICMSGLVYRTLSKSVPHSARWCYVGQNSCIVEATSIKLLMTDAGKLDVQSTENSNKFLFSVPKSGAGLNVFLP